MSAGRPRCHVCGCFHPAPFQGLLTDVFTSLLLATVPFCALDLGSPLPGPAQPKGSHSSFCKLFMPKAPTWGSAVAENVLFITETNPMSTRASHLDCTVSLSFGLPKKVRRVLPACTEGRSAPRARRSTDGLSADRESVEN